MLEGYSLVILLLAISIVLLIGETLLPTHGVLGIVGIAAILIAIFVAARQNVWAGVALMVAVAGATPLAWTAFIKIWPKTPVGKRLILPDVADKPGGAIVQVGQSGTTVSDLRPTGICEFAGMRVEAISEHGIVRAGTPVTVIALSNNRPTVRIVA